MQLTQFEDTSLQHRLVLCSRFCLAAALLIGVAGFCGWALDIRWLRRPFAQFVAINPLTAVLFMLAVAAQYCLVRPTRAKSVAAVTMASLVMGTAAVKLVDIASPGTAPVDQLLFANALEHDRLGDVPNRMAPNTAFCFFWLGIATLLSPLGQRGKLFPAQLALIPLVLAALLSVLGYLFQVPRLYGLSNYIPMALHTGAGFLALSLGMITATPNQGILRHFTTSLAGSRLARWLVPGTILVPVLLGFVRLIIDRQYGIPVELGVVILVLSIIVILTSLVWVTTRALNLKDHEQSLVRDELAQMNIHLEKIVQERTAATLRTETRLRQVLDAMSEGFQIIGFDWRYLYVNDAVARQAKTPKEVLLRSTFLELFPTSANAELMDAFRRCFKNREPLHMENRFIFADGSEGWFDLHFQPIPEGLFILSSDITHRKKNEEHIRRINDELEQKVVARTAQLEAVNKELNSFCYSVSHDLRAPLRTLTGYVRMLQETAGSGLNDEARKLVTVIENKAARMNQLIADLLAFSQLGAQEIHPAPVDMDLLLSDAVHDLFPDGLPGNLVLQVDSLGTAYGDASLLNQVLLNLLSNAVKYSARQPQPTVQVRSVVEADQVIFEIRDNGVGFDMQFADKLFGVFQRLHSSSDFEGTGVGLAIVQRIVHKHGGRVWADSTPGNGARFCFSLPEAGSAKS